MIAWTSPLPTVRSIPCRISRSGAAAGATRRPRMTRCWSVSAVGSVTGSSGLPGLRSGLDGARGRRGDARRDEVGEGHRVERAGDGIADADPQDVDGAARRAIAQVRVFGVVAGAQHRGDRALERAQDLGHRDGLGRAGELVAAVCAAGAGHETGLAEADDQLLEIRAREVFLGGDLRERRRTHAVMAPELDHQPDAVLALRGEGDGAAAVIAGRVAQRGRDGGRGSGQGNVLDIRVISSDMSLRGPPESVNRPGAARGERPRAVLSPTGEASPRIGRRHGGRSRP